MESTRGAALRDFAPSAAFVCLEAFAALSSDALLHHIVRDIGATPAATAVALGASYFAGRGISQLLAPAYLAALEPHRLLEVSALLFGVLAVWLACVPSLLQVAAARFALGIAAGSSEANLLAMPTACAHTGRQRPYALYIAHMSALVGFAFAQAPFAALCSSLGWRHAVLLACTLPGVVILAATRVLRVWMPPRGRPVDATAAGGTGGGSLSFPSDWVGAALAQARKLNFAVRPVAAMAVATQTPLHLLGAGWGVLMLREGLGARARARASRPLLRRACAARRVRAWRFAPPCARAHRLTHTPCSLRPLPPAAAARAPRRRGRPCALSRLLDASAQAGQRCWRCALPRCCHSGRWRARAAWWRRRAHRAPASSASRSVRASRSARGCD